MYELVQRHNKIYILENDKLVEKYDTLNDINSLEGNIYIGKVENVLKGMRLAFINIGKDKNGVLSFDDLLRKHTLEEIFEILKPRKKYFSTG